MVEKVEGTNKRLAGYAVKLCQTNQNLVAENSGVVKAKESIEAEVQWLEREIERLDAENGAYKAAQAWLESESKMSKSSIEEAKAKRAQDEAKLTDLVSDLLEANEANEALQLSLATEKQARQQLGEDLRGEKARHEATSSELHMAKAQIGDDVEVEATNLVHATNALEVKIAGLQSTIGDLGKEVDGLKQNNELDLTKSRLNQSSPAIENAKLKNEYDDTRNRLSEAEEKASTTESNLIEAKTENETHHDTLAKERRQRSKLGSDLRNECANHTKTASELALLRKTAESKTADLEQKMKASTATTQELGRKVEIVGSESTKATENHNNIQLELSRHKRILIEEKATTQRLKQDLDKAFKRELEYAPSGCMSNSMTRRLITPPASCVSKTKLPNEMRTFRFVQRMSKPSTLSWTQRLRR